MGAPCLGRSGSSPLSPVSSPRSALGGTPLSLALCRSFSVSVFLWGQVIQEYSLPGLNSFSSLLACFLLGTEGVSFLTPLSPPISRLLVNVGYRPWTCRRYIGIPFISVCESASCGLSLSHSCGTSCPKWQEASKHPNSELFNQFP